MRGAEQWQYPVKWCERDARAGKMKMERAGGTTQCGRIVEMGEAPLDACGASEQKTAMD